MFRKIWDGNLPEFWALLTSLSKKIIYTFFLLIFILILFYHVLFFKFKYVIIVWYYIFETSYHYGMIGYTLDVSN